jgi:uncharacterized membrane-anchored protein YitT (DUF2179 family)
MTVKGVTIMLAAVFYGSVIAMTLCAIFNGPSALGAWLFLAMFLSAAYFVAKGVLAEM